MNYEESLDFRDFMKVVMEMTFKLHHPSYIPLESLINSVHGIEPTASAIDLTLFSELTQKQYIHSALCLQIDNISTILF